MVRQLTGRARTARSQGIASARRAFAAQARAEVSGIPAAELIAAAARRDRERSRRGGEQGQTRRELLAAGAALAGVSLAAGPAEALARAARHRPTPGAPRIAIVGAGLAGLRCAHMLWAEGGSVPLAATVYEANPERAGGRCWTLRGFFADGLISEHGGAFLNGNQRAVRGLAAKLGLREEVVSGGDLPNGSEVFWIGGSVYTEEEAQRDWEEVGYAAFRRAARQLADPAGEARLDAMSVPDWLDSTAIGAHSRFGRLMLANAVTENGGDPADMSALDLIELLTGNPRDALVPLPGDGEPLREVDLSRSGLPADKQRVIRTMGMGTNAKVHVELTHKTWPGLGYSGATYGEWNRLACAWDDCVQLGPNASPALWLAFPGAVAGASGLTGAAHGPAPSADTAFVLGEIEHLFKGTTAAFTGRAYEDHWAADPFVHGAYSYYRVGQAASYGAIAGRTNGRMLFAGEHTSIANIGFLDGAVETGERAARRLQRWLA